jgi:hypothetical protein
MPVSNSAMVLAVEIVPWSNSGIHPVLVVVRIPLARSQPQSYHYSCLLDSLSRSLKPNQKKRERQPQMTSREVCPEVQAEGRKGSVCTSGYYKLMIAEVCHNWLARCLHKQVMQGPKEGV